MDIFDRFVDTTCPIQKLWGLHIWEPLDGQVKINALLIQHKKGSLYIREQYNWEGFDNVPEHIFGRIPVCLSYDSVKVLMKVVDDHASHSICNAFHVSDIELFKIQISELGNRFLVSMIRQDQLNALLESLKRFNIDLLGLTLGGIHLNCAKSLISEDRVGVEEFYNYTVEWGSDEMVRIERLKERFIEDVPIQMGSQVLLQRYLLPYCNALCWYLYRNAPPYLKAQEIITEGFGYLYRRSYGRILYGAVAIIFTLLLVNFIIWNHYRDQQGKLEQERLIYQSEVKRLANLELRVKDYKLLKAQLDAGNNGCFSWYADQIALSVKQRIQLKTISIHPMVREGTMRGHQLSFEEGVIKISGHCAAPVQMSEWVRELLEIPFVTGIEQQVYEFDDREQVGSFSFVLKVKGYEMDRTDL